MKRLFYLVILLVLAGAIYLNRDKIYSLANTYLSSFRTVSLGEVNQYYRDYNFEFVQNTDNFYPQNEQDILNIYYTVINAGKNSFTFYCPDEYEECLTEIQNLANDQDKLSDINNYVHPFNGFSHIETEYDSLGRVTINITKTYSEEDIDKINSEVDRLLVELTSDSYSSYDNIKNVHDYIINHTSYDTVKNTTGESDYHSNTAYGPLFEGHGICGGYTDLMQLFLEKLGIESFRVSSDKHVWNAVYYNNRWVHLDLTWDDPVANDGNNYLEYHYFLIDTHKLLSIETTEHTFNQSRYPELKEA